MAAILGEVSVSGRFNMAEHLVDRHVLAGHGDRRAVIFQSHSFSYSELFAMVNRAGNVLRQYGLHPEQRCLIALPDSPSFLAAFLGAMKIGAVPVPLNPGLPISDYLYFLEDSGAHLAVVSPDVAVLLQRSKEHLPRQLQILMAGSSCEGGHVSLDEALAAASDTLLAAPTAADDVSYWLYTSGTTGKPKGVVHLHQDMMQCVPPYASYVLQATPDDVFLSASKLYFSYGLVNSLFLPLQLGATTLLNPGPPSPQTLFELMPQGPTLLFSVPTGYAAILHDGGLQDCSSLRLCISAGEPLPAAIYERWRARFGLEILDGVGSSECGYIYISNRPGEVRPGSSGRLLPPYRARLVNEESAHPGSGETGELYLSGESVALCYWRKRRQTKETFVGEWLRTHDNFRVDADGFYYFQGRSDDMIKVGGIYVSPTEVESAFMEHRAVRECAVVAATDEFGLVKARAFVVLRDPCEPSPALEKDLAAYVKARIAAYKYPRWLQFVPELPKTGTGKVQRYLLRKHPAPS